MVDYSWYKYQLRLVKDLESNPVYAKLEDKYDTSVYLVNSQESLIELMVKATKRWYESHFLPHIDWFFEGSYEEYFEKNMGMTVEFFNEFSMKVNVAASHNNKIIEMGKGMPQAYAVEQEGIKHAELYESVANGNTDFNAGELMAQLMDATFNDKPMFSLERFDTI